MSRVTRLLALVVLVLGLGTGRAAAQEREGFFFGVGAGYGSLDLTCDGCEFDRESGLSGMLRLGGAISERFLLGVESEGWFKDEDGGSVSAGTLTASAYYYPVATAGLFVRGGVGLATLSVDFDFGGSESEYGFGWSVGAGYDIRISTNKAITPYFNWMWGTVEDGGWNVYQVGAALSIY